MRRKRMGVVLLASAARRDQRPLVQTGGHSTGEGAMTEREAAMIDRAFADGMRLALAMAAQGAEEKAREIADRMLADGRRVILATH